MSSSIPSLQILTAHAQPFRGARDLTFCLKVPLDSLLVWASSRGSGGTARMRRLAWTAARIGDKYQIRLTWCIFLYKLICLILFYNYNFSQNYFLCLPYRCTPEITARIWYFFSNQNAQGFGRAWKITFCPHISVTKFDTISNMYVEPKGFRLTLSHFDYAPLFQGP